MSDIRNHLQRLGRINKGDDPRTVASSDRINAMQEIIKSMLRGDHVSTNRNHLRKRTGDGLFQLTSARAPRFASQDEKSLQLYDASDTDGLKVGITFGTVAGLVPVGWSDYLSNPSSSPNPFIISANGESWGNVFAEVTVTNPLTLSIPESVRFLEAAQNQFDDETHVYLVVGTYGITTNSEGGRSLTVASALSGSQSLICIVHSNNFGPYLIPFWLQV